MEIILAAIGLGFTFVFGAVSIYYQARADKKGTQTKLSGAEVKRVLVSSPSFEAGEIKITSILSEFVYVWRSSNYNTGLFSKVNNRVFLDLFSACTIEANRISLAKVLVDGIEEDLQSISSVNCVAVPKEGNVLLAAECARILKLPLLIVRISKPIRFGYPIEGVVHSGMVAIIIDDILSDGGLIARCAQRLRKSGVNVNIAAFLVERTDNSGRSVVGDSGLDLYCRMQVDEAELKSLQNLGRPPHA